MSTRRPRVDCRDPQAADELWHPRSWLVPPQRPSSGSIAPEVAIVGTVAALHIADHTLFPQRYHVGIHLATAAAAVTAAVSSGATAGDLGLRTDRLRRGLRRGLGVGGAITIGIAAAAAAPRTRGYFVDERVMDLSRRELAAKSLLHIPLGTAVYEELIFRGVVLGLALRRMSPLPAVALTSSLFGLWHVLPALKDRSANPATRHRPLPQHLLGTVVATTIAGYLFAWERLRANSVLAPVLTHTATNAVTYALAGAVASRAADLPPADLAPSDGASRSS